MTDILNRSDGSINPFARFQRKLNAKMKINIFNSNSSLFQFRWFIVALLVFAATMVYYDITGRRIFTSSGAEEWSSSGPGYHK